MFVLVHAWVLLTLVTACLLLLVMLAQAGTRVVRQRVAAAPGGLTLPRQPRVATSGG